MLAWVLLKKLIFEQNIGFLICKVLPQDKEVDYNKFRRVQQRKFRKKVDRKIYRQKENVLIKSATKFEQILYLQQHSNY